MKTRSAAFQACCHYPYLDRRGFLTRCAACAAGAAGLAALDPIRGFAQEGRRDRARVHLVFTHVPSTGPIWPNIGYDFEKRKAELTDQLARACPEIEFLPVTCMNSDEAKRLLEKDGEVDGYLVYLLGLWTGAARTLAPSNRPMIFADDLYGGSGEFLIDYARSLRAGHKVAGVSSSRFQDVVNAVQCFQVLKRHGATADDFLAACEAARKGGIHAPADLACREDAVKVNGIGACLEKLKASRILVVGRNPGDLGKSIHEVFGTEVVPIEFAALDAAYREADPEAAARQADAWIEQAEKVIEPTREEIAKSGAMYLAMKDLLARHEASAIAINCLGGFYGGHITAYPCLGFHQLNNDGLVGACEADLLSTITMVAMGHLVERPGFISDPVIDTSKYQAIYAHCVAPCKVFGPEGRANPYHIRDHSEDRKGAAIRSLMPLGYMTTTLEFHPIRKETILHQGRTADNIDHDMACRTKLAVEVKGDLDKLLTEWDRWGWHRVTFYGDLKEPVKELSAALNLEVVEEA